MWEKASKPKLASWTGFLDWVNPGHKPQQAEDSPDFLVGKKEWVRQVPCSLAHIPGISCSSLDVWGWISPHKSSTTQGKNQKIAQNFTCHCQYWCFSWDHGKGKSERLQKPSLMWCLSLVCVKLQPAKCSIQQLFPKNGVFSAFSWFCNVNCQSSCIFWGEIFLMWTEPNQGNNLGKYHAASIFAPKL